MPESGEMSTSDEIKTCLHADSIAGAGKVVVPIIQQVAEVGCLWRIIIFVLAIIFAIVAFKVVPDEGWRSGGIAIVFGIGGMFYMALTMGGVKTGFAYGLEMDGGGVTMRGDGVSELIRWSVVHSVCVMEMGDGQTWLALMVCDRDEPLPANRKWKKMYPVERLSPELCYVGVLPSWAYEDLDELGRCAGHLQALSER